MFSICCCVFRPAFECCAHPKACQTTFFSRFQPFLFFQNLFQWFHGWNQQKTSWNEQKNWYLSTPQSWSTCKSWSTHGRSTSNLYKKSTKKRQIRGTPSWSWLAFACQPALRSRKYQFFFVHFQKFFVHFSCEITKEGFKRTEKVENG